MVTPGRGRAEPLTPPRCETIADRARAAPWSFGSGPAVATLFARALALVSLDRLAVAGRAGAGADRQPRAAAGRRLHRGGARAAGRLAVSTCRRSLWWFHSDGALTAGHRAGRGAVARARCSASRAGSASRCRRCSISRTSPSRATSCRSSGTTCCSSAASWPPSCPPIGPAPARPLPVPAGAVQALLRIGHRQVAVAAARLARRQRDDLLLRDRAAADLARLSTRTTCRSGGTTSRAARRWCWSSSSRSGSSARAGCGCSRSRRSRCSRSSTPPPPTTASSATWRWCWACSCSTTRTSSARAPALGRAARFVPAARAPVRARARPARAAADPRPRTPPLLTPTARKAWLASRGAAAVRARVARRRAAPLSASPAPRSRS